MEKKGFKLTSGIFYFLDYPEVFEELVKGNIQVIE